MDRMNYWKRQRASRRRFLQGAGATAVGTAGLSLVGCGNDDDDAVNGGNGDDSDDAPGETPAADGSPQRGGEIVVRRPSSISFGDPIRASSGYDTTSSHLFAAPMLHWSEDQEAEAQIVSDWEQADDHTLIFHLREDLVFQDGTPVNAEAVEYSMSRAADPAIGPSSRHYLDGVTVEPTDEHTVTFSFETPQALFLEVMTQSPPSGLGSLVSPTAVEEMGEDRFGQEPVSVGPFHVEQFVRDGESVFRANPDWPITDADGNKLPYLDAVRLNVVGETSVAVAELQAGSIDLDFVFLAENAEQIENNDDLDLFVQIGGLQQGLRMIIDREPTDIQAFRQAINYALDREEFASVFLGEYGAPGEGILTPVARQYREDAPAYTYDPDRAAQLLEQAGMEDGAQVSIVTYTSGVYPRVGELVQAQLGRVGIEASVDSVEIPVYTEQFVDQGEYNLGAFGAGVSEGDAYFFLAGRYAGGIDGGNEVPEIEELLREASQTFDDEERASIYRDIEEMDHDLAYIAWLMQAPRLAAYNNNLHGFRWVRTGSSIEFNRAWLES